MSQGLPSSVVQHLVNAQSGAARDLPNAHGHRLKELLVRPTQIPMIVRWTNNGQVRDELTHAWLIAREPSDDGYQIVMRDDGAQFGLAVPGSPDDPHLVLVGWYGDLFSAFSAM